MKLQCNLFVHYYDYMTRTRGQDDDKMPEAVPCAGCEHVVGARGFYRNRLHIAQRGALHKLGGQIRCVFWIVYVAVAFLAYIGCCTVNAMDADNNNQDRNIMSKLPVFTGKKEAFVMWMAKFMDVATMGAYAQAVTYNANA
jgi:hypothetical protein